MTFYHQPSKHKLYNKELDIKISLVLNLKIDNQEGISTKRYKRQRKKNTERQKERKREKGHERGESLICLVGI